MDDFLGMMFNSLPPERKLLTAITNKMWSSMQQLIDEGGSDLVNAKLSKQDGKTALHLICQTGHHEFIHRLVAAGANINETDFFGFTPLALALRFARVDCVRVLLAMDWRGSPSDIWHGLTASGSPMWEGYDQKLLQILIIASPDIYKTYLEVAHTLFNKYFLKDSARYSELIKIYLMTGNILTSTQLTQLMSTNAELSEWIKSFLSVQSLEYYARVSVRQHLRPNVNYAANKLPLPDKLKLFLTFTDDS